MMPRPAARARATKSGSTFLKQNSACAGTLEGEVRAGGPRGGGGGRGAGAGGGGGRGELGPGRRPFLPRIGDDSRERRGRGRHGRAEIDLVVADAAPSREVAVERAQALASGGAHTPDAGAGAARGLRHRGAR